MTSAAFALVGASLAEGVVAAVQATRGGADVQASLLALVATGLVMVAGGLLPALSIGWLVDRSATRALGAGIREALGGSAALTIATLAAVLAATLAASALLGRAVIEMMTARFAAAAVALVTIAALSIFASAFAPIGAALGRVLGPRARAPLALPVALSLCAAAVLAASLVTMPPAYAFTPAAALVALALLALPPARDRITQATAGRRGPLALAALAAVATGALACLHVLPPASQSALLYRAPYAGNLIATVWRLTDADGDGFSPYLLGGDCDDAEPSIHPGAHDAPDNGIDENCSGADATVYEPLAPPTARPTGLAERPNIVLIQVDALRPDHLGFTGYERPTSPRIDRFREDATLFENAYTTAPSTRFAMTSAFTGYDARRVPHDDLGGNRFRLRPGAVTVAERLGARGYDTMGYSITYVLQHNLGLGQGFRRWVTPWPIDDWAANYPVAAERTSNAAIDYLGQMPEDGSRPFLLFTHYRCTHDPYIQYEEWHYGAEDVDAYDSALNYCDREIGRVLDALEARDDHDRTVIVLFSDHGELFGEHGLTNHGNSLYEPDVRVALLVRIPGVDVRTVSTPVSLADVAPTVLELAGLSTPPDLEGWSLLAHLSSRPPSDPAARPLFMFTDLWRANVHIRANAVLRWPMKYIRDGRTGAEQLFDVAADPREENDVSADAPEIRGELSEMLDAYQAFIDSRSR